MAVRRPLTSADDESTYAGDETPAMPQDAPVATPQVQDPGIYTGGGTGYVPTTPQGITFNPQPQGGLQPPPDLSVPPSAKEPVAKQPAVQRRGPAALTNDQEDRPPAQPGDPTVTVPPPPAPPVTGPQYDQARYNAIQQYYQKYLGRNPDANDQGFMGWVNGQYSLPDVEKYIQASDEAKKYTAHQGGGGNSPTDPMAAIRALYAKYGLDPNNPGHGLADIDYFYGRGNDTGGGWGNTGNYGYWLGTNGGVGRIEQEIRSAVLGEHNPYDEGGGGGGGQPGDQQVGDDEFSRTIQQRLMDLLNGGGYLPDEAMSLENARDTANRFRRAGMADIAAQQADRGQTDQFNPTGGQFQDAQQRFEANQVQPMFASAMRDYLTSRNQQANDMLQFALGQSNQRQGMLGDLALRNLAQSQQFSEFLATFGLQRDQVLAELQNGGNNSLMQLLALFLGGFNGSRGGYV